MYEPIVDYFSFTIPIPQLMTQWEVADRLEMGNLFDDRTSDFLYLLSQQKNWREQKFPGRFPRGVVFNDIGMTYMEGEKSNVSLVQFSGKGCKWLRDNNLLEGVLETWKDRTTRVDVAIDIVSDADPETFSRMLSNKRFTTDSHEKSNTGTTWYVGSYKSDRFCRVYRYSNELARGNTLRIEYQFGNEQAKHCAEMCCNEGIFNVAIQLGILYGWTHPDYNLSKDDTKFVSKPRPQVRAGKELWLQKQVLPSLIKEAMNGNVQLLIDLKDKLCAIIDEYVSFEGD